MQRTVLALVAVLALAGGCGQSAPAKIAVTSIDGEAGVDASDGSSARSGMALCCALPPVDAGSGDAAVTSGAADNCSVIARNGFGVVEPCLSSNSAGTFGLWTCGAGSPQMQCGNNGLSCTAGDPCTLVDIGCTGVVQACTFTPYTPPPGPSDSGLNDSSAG
jgi:hypothetical protein